ncbi:MinD-like ATPase involved in chromosome partitioning or flagellar assembly [Actinomadura meyerae]|uniref:MinD-like ATPase involved in chromosome partitioning or flagellar assembly n=1 Tax=Actinomadura meyerae TaxID=240840 RepID=A0A239FVY2_9ACTN|nr:TcpE family conjugal transfer membrane protein [Actinomadura meyerae]SNS61157.1 MinD-like ATPase involved in chromosome partitioning or flagellar assembly [Actinomadura meyerae]
MDLPTYTNIWRIEKRLYKLYDLRLPMPLPLVQIGVFLGVFVPWILLLRLVGVPFESPWHVLYIVPPGVLTWLATRPVIEGKRLTELLLSQSRYLAEPRTWCRLTPIREPREVVIVARVWRRAEGPAPVAAAERAAIKSRRRRRHADPEPTPLPARMPRPATAAAPPPLVEYAAQQEQPAPQEQPAAREEQPAAAPPKPWRRTTRDIFHEDDVLPLPAAEMERPPATPQLENPAGSGKRALASGVRRPGAPAEIWQAAPATRPDIPQQHPADIRRAAEEIANGPREPAPDASATAPRAPAPGHPGEPAPAEGPRQPSPTGTTPAPAAPHTPAPSEPTRPQGPAHPAHGAAHGRGVPAPGPAAAGGPTPEAASSEGRPSPARPAQGPGVPVAGPGAAGAPAAEQAPSERTRQPGMTGGPAAGTGATAPESAPPGGTPQPAGATPAAGADAGQRVRAQEAASRGGASGGEPGDKKVAGPRAPVPPPPPWAPPVTRPDVPMVPGAFGAPPRPAPPAPRREPPKPWSEGLSRPQRPAAENPVRPAEPPAAQPAAQVPAAQVPAPQVPAPQVPAPQVPAPPPPVPQVPQPAHPGDEQAPPREVRSQPASPVRPRPLPPPPAPPPSGPAITPPGPEHEVSTGGFRRLIHAVGGGHGEVDAEYQQRLQQPFHGTRHVVVLGCTGGAGQTVTALMLGHTFAQHNGEPVVAIDVNPGPGALARRTRSETNETLTGLITRADQVGSLTAMRRYTSQAKSGLDVIAAGKNPLQALDDRDYALAIRTIDRFYSVTLLDAAAAVVARVLPYADQIVLVAPASADAPRAVAMTFEWLDGHGYEELRSRAVTVINGVSRRSMDDVEQAEAVARGRCRALVRIPWDDHLSMDRAPRNELKSLRTPTRRAYLALAGVVAGGFSVMPERYQELQQEQEATR